MKLEIIVTKGKHQGQRWSVDQPGTYRLGRRSDADLSLADDPHVSRQHCQIELTIEGVCRLVDTSSGGTFIGGERVHKTQLADEDVISLGQTLLHVSLSGSALRIPGFILDKPLTGVGPGEIWAATSELLDQPVALHFLTLSPADKVNKNVIQRRFLREAGICARTYHPGLLNFLDQNISGGFLWFATEPVQGLTLQQWVAERGPLSIPEAIEVISQTLDTVAYLHQKGIVHRTLRPQSLLVQTEANTLKTRLTDLGSAKCFQPVELQFITAFGERGFPIHVFSAPEALRDFKAVDPRSDLYAIGAILYFILAGRPPYEASKKEGLLTPILQGNPPALSRLNPGLPPAVVAVVERAMAPEPARRYQTAPEMLDALRRTADTLQQPQSPKISSSGSWPRRGELIDHYEIIAEQGRGRMGTVYRVRDTRTGREVALKLFRAPKPAVSTKKEQADTSAARLRQRFEREIKLASQLNHPHIVTVYDVNLQHEPPYLVMELLTGGSLEERFEREENLEEWLQQGKTLKAWLARQMRWADALTLLRPLVQALAYTHQAGAVHRDVKPANIMFTAPQPPPSAQGAVLKLVDFGLAYWDQSVTLTQAGDILGEFSHLSPEQARSQPVDGRSDIFAAGLILFEAITGVNPLDKGPLVQTMLELSSDQPLDTELLHRLKLPQPMIELIEQAVAKNPAERQPTCEALLAQMDVCLEMARDIAAPASDFGLENKEPPTLPVIEHDERIELNGQEQSLLKALFGTHDRILIEEQFLRGLSSSRVLRVRPVDETGVRPYLPAVVKIGPRWLIEQEWRAYKFWVEKILPDIARLEGSPILGRQQGILRYALVGSGIFPVQSLYNYYQQHDAETIRRLLAVRLFKVLGKQYWQARRPDLACHLAAEYDAVLPVNLLLKFVDTAPLTPAHLIEPGLDPGNYPGHLPPSTIQIGDNVQLKDFVVTEIDLPEHQLTLNLPPTSGERAPLSAQVPSGYRLRLIDVPHIEQFRAGQTLDLIRCQVTATRPEMLAETAKRILPNTLDLTAETLPLSAELHLPNPLLAYPDILQQSRPLYRATVHGDLNLENILIDTETDILSLIDFATVRRGHSLHDLLRLETEVVTKLLPGALRHEKSPLHTLHYFYNLLHRMMIPTNKTIVSMPLTAELKKALTVLATIRQAATEHLFDRSDWTEYYQGLTLYLLGALKFKNLEAMPEHPLPKQIAFWGAATVADFLGRSYRTPPDS